MLDAGKTCEERRRMHSVGYPNKVEGGGGEGSVGGHQYGYLYVQGWGKRDGVEDVVGQGQVRGSPKGRQGLD